MPKIEKTPVDVRRVLETTKRECTKQLTEPMPSNGWKLLPVTNKPPKNIRKSNIIDAIRLVPPLPKHRVQDTRNGHVIVLNEAGLEPTYVSKKVVSTTCEIFLFLILQNNGNYVYRRVTGNKLENSQNLIFFFL